MNKVLHGDCLELMKDIPDGSIDMILCDLPYGTTQNKWDAVISFEPLWAQYERVIKNNGAIVLTANQPFTSSLVMSNPRMFKYCWTWDKVVSSGFLNAKKQPLKRIEDICVFYNKQPTYNPQFEKRTDAEVKKFKEKQSCKGVGTENYNDYELIKTKNPDKKYPTNLIIENSKNNDCNSKNRLHPTQKPVSLFEYLIKTYTNEGDTVLDNCAGSGTTGVAAINTNRNYILMEKEEKYFEIIEKRIKKHKLEKQNELNFEV